MSALLPYYDRRPDPSVPLSVAFGTSGHRGSSFDATFNEWHILAISQAVCLYRASHQINGPLFVGMDTHALSQPALHSAVEVFAANGVNVMLSTGDEFTPTPAISHAILKCNHGRVSGLADGIVITPSHNPPRDGGFKYNSTNGGPAELDVTRWIENTANEFLANALRDVKRMPFDRALRAPTTGRHDYLEEFTGDLDQVIDVEAIRSATLSLGVDPLGGAAWYGTGSERYRLNHERQRRDDPLRVHDPRWTARFAWIIVSGDAGLIILRTASTSRCAIRTRPPASSRRRLPH